MKTKLRKLLSFWQEIVFIITLGVLFTGIILNYSTSFQSFINIIFCCLLLISIVCLIGQFFWKNKYIASIIGVILGLASFYMVLATLSDFIKPNLDSLTLPELLLGLFFFIGLCVTAITMPFKYHLDDELVKEKQ